MHQVSGFVWDIWKKGGGIERENESAKVSENFSVMKRDLRVKVKNY